MDLLGDTLRLQMLKAVGAEQFDTGEPSPLWAVFEGEFNDPELSGINIEGEVVWLEARLSDRNTHKLVKGSKLKRLSDGQEMFVRRLEPSKSSGFLVIRINK